MNIKKFFSKGEVLSEKEMKKVEVRTKNCCAYSTILFGPLVCVDSSDEAEQKAGTTGWLGCNNEEVKKACGCEENK